MLKKLLKNLLQKFTEGLSWKMMGAIIVGAAIATFGVHNIHQQTAITEGGVIGMILAVPVGAIILNFYKAGTFDGAVNGLKEAGRDLYQWMHNDKSL